LATDYIKLRVIEPDIKKILASTQLDFKGSFSASTGVVYDDKIIAELHFCKVIVYKSGTILFSGSIHKMYNSIKGIKAPNHNKSKDKKYKGFNGNQFGTQEMSFMINYLEKLLYQKASYMLMRCIELGLNMPIDFDPRFFIIGLLFLRSTPFEFKYNRNFAQIMFEDFRVKIYNKSKQYGMDKDTIRIEVNFSRMDILNIIGIKTLDMTPEQLFKGLNLVLGKFDGITYFDKTIRTKELSKPQKKNLPNYKSVMYWLDDLEPNKRHEPKQKLNKIIANHSSNLKEIIRNQFLKTRVINTQHFQDITKVINTHSSIGVNITNNTPIKQKCFCAITGISLDLEKDLPKYIRTTTLNHLKKTDYKTYDLLRIDLLCNYVTRPKFESDEINHLAKQIRNRYYNKFKIKDSGYKLQKPLENQMRLAI